MTIKISQLRVETLYFGSGQSGSQIKRSREDALLELRGGIPKPLHARYDEMTINARRLESYKEPVDLGRYAGCRLAIGGAGFWAYFLYIIPSQGSYWLLQGAMKAEQRLGTLSKLPSEGVRIFSIVDSQQSDRAWEIQYENWRNNLHWSTGLDVLG